MFLVGFLSAYVYRCAIRGKCWAVFTLGAFVYATVMTIFSEEYFAQIMFWVKAGGALHPGLLRSQHHPARSCTLHG